MPFLSWIASSRGGMTRVGGTERGFDISKRGVHLFFVLVFDTYLRLRLLFPAARNLT